jgi:predicted RNA-binding Zn-ribbon protein involved in translation (DUF1610 family)
VSDGTTTAGAFAADTTAQDFDERWTISDLADASRLVDDRPSNPLFRDEPDLLANLGRRLKAEQIGLRLYATGAEPFLWRVMAVAAEAGMGRDEVRLFAGRLGPRRVYCNHCSTIAEGVVANVATCPGCGAALFVRDHFSRRLNAFAGVKIDAEVPGDIPPVEVLYA